jgi:2-(1,2-epoxy-1,2-dihydrophenyl)acetyl-CoA isomerase
MAGVKREREGAVGILTLDEAASLNAMTPELFGDLKLAIDEMLAGGARALVLTGAGRGFCSGQNLKAFESLGDDLVEGVTRAYWECFRTLRECAVPVVVAVNGVAAGGGFSLAMSGDVTVAARSASFIQVFSRIGLVPDLGSTWLLPRLVGRQRALEMMLFNQPIKADQAREWGIVHTVFEDAELRAGAVALAAKLAEGPTRALVATRALLEESGRNDYATQFRRELEVQNVMRDTADAREGRQAFVEKRPARFTGR